MHVQDRTEPFVPAPLPEAERIARLRLCRSANVGPRTFAGLLHRYRSAERALEALPGLAASGGKAGYAVCPLAEVEAELEAGHRAGARLILLDELAYPVMLGAIDSPPPAIWVRGDPAILERPAIAMVGARNASALGVRTAQTLAFELGKLRQVIVSGLARGIDSAAHRAALDSGTVAVMPGGVDWVYPPENADLAAAIAEKGALVSECPMGMEPTSRHFPRRNRLISGLSRGVVLIEAALRSGSLITARYALEQGREAMACPGAPEDPRSGGCNQLIREGAALIRNAEDVLEAVSGPRRLELAEPGRAYLFDDDDAFRNGYDEGDLDDGEDFDDEFDGDFDGGDRDATALADQIMRLLGPHPVECDEVCRQCGATPPEFSLAVLELDLAGRIVLLPGAKMALAGPEG